jgi:hypothetical protein
MSSAGRRALAVALVLAVAAPTAAELRLPPGFSARTYVTGHGFDGDGPGIPSTSTLAFDAAGTLYLARTGRRYLGGEVEDVWPVYRIPAGGARLSPDSERRFFFGPPLPNPQVAAVRGGELLVTTFDRERMVGVLYRIVDGYAEMLAGGTPPPGAPALFRQPEGAAIDHAGRLYVADRDRGVIVRLDASGRVLDPRWFAARRPRLLAVDEDDAVWVGADGEAEAPWQRGPGEIIRIAGGAARVVSAGPVAAGMAIAPGGRAFVADRQGARIFVVDRDGRHVDFASFTDGDAPRALAWAPVTADTRRAGIAGDLFLVMVRRSTFRLNDVIRISGPFEEFAGR